MVKATSFLFQKFDSLRYVYSYVHMYVMYVAVTIIVRSGTYTTTYMYVCMCVHMYSMYVYVALIYDTKHVGTTTVEEPGVVIYHPGVTILPIELTCDASPGVAWLVNDTSYIIIQLQNGNLPGHNVSGRNILITSIPMNNSRYVCSDGKIYGAVYLIVVSGEYANLFVCVYIHVCRSWVYCGLYKGIATLCM